MWGVDNKPVMVITYVVSLWQPMKVGGIYAGDIHLCGEFVQSKAFKRAKGQTHGSLFTSMHPFEVVVSTLYSNIKRNRHAHLH